MSVNAPTVPSKPLILLTSCLPVYGRRRMKLRRKRQIKAELRDITAERKVSEQRLAASERQLAKDTKTVIEPLRRTRREMLEHNHVADTLVAKIRHGGAMGHGA